MNFYIDAMTDIVRILRFQNEIVHKLAYSDDIFKSIDNLKKYIKHAKEFLNSYI